MKNKFAVKKDYTAVWLWVIVVLIMVFAISCISESQTLNVRIIEDIYVIKTPTINKTIHSGKIFIYRSAISHGELNKIVNERLIIYFKSTLTLRVTVNPQKHQFDFEVTVSEFNKLIMWLCNNHVPIYYQGGELANPNDLIERLKANDKIDG